uniref:Uncharacterized protein n=1 Tax=Branchiostoma floridae TaxID=7739 RepID=C3YJR0_BRAFL|eukprot:XP_002603356.1 hypothetical protein BRAFLDRAFT_80349 [Branchiostoma floridae]
MQTARAALGVALRVCPRTAVSTYNRPAAELPPSGHALQAIKTGHADWSGLDLGLFIGAGVLVTAGLYETPAGVLCRSAAFPFGKNDRADWPRERQVGVTRKNSKSSPSLMRDKALSTAEDVRTASAESKKTPGDVVDEDAVNKRGEGSSVGTPQSLPNTKGSADHNKAGVSSENDVTVCDDDQGPAKEMMMSNSDISDQKSPSACSLGGGQVSEGNAGKDHEFCVDDDTSDVTNDIMHTCSLPATSDGENAGNDVISRWEETSPRRADFTEAEVITVTACPVRHELSAATREVIGSTPHGTEKTDTEISSEQFLSEGHFDYESGHLSQHVTVSPRLERKLRCAVLYADWREDSQFCHRDDVTTNLRVRFSWFGQEDDDDLFDVTEVKVYYAVLEGVWREECGLVEKHVTSMTSDDDDMESYYPGHGRRNGIQSGNENLV